jgi:hypothetical protein
VLPIRLRVDTRHITFDILFRAFIGALPIGADLILSAPVADTRFFAVSGCTAIVAVGIRVDATATTDYLTAGTTVDAVAVLAALTAGTLRFQTGVGLTFAVQRVAERALGTNGVDTLIINAFARFGYTRFSPVAGHHRARVDLAITLHAPFALVARNLRAAFETKPFATRLIC